MKYLLSCLLFVFLATANAQDIQWASKVVNYSSQKEFEIFSAIQALGTPNSMPNKGYSGTAWSPAGDERKEFIQVGFEKPIKVKQLVVAENCNPGSICKISFFDKNNTEFEVYKAKADTLNDFSRFFTLEMPETVYEVFSVKIIIDCRVTPGLNQIDAIGISSTVAEFKQEIKVAKEIRFFSKPEKLPSTINSQYTEVHPVISPDGKSLIVNRKDFPPNTKDDEAWISNLQQNGEWEVLKKITGPINNSNNNFVSGISPDGNSLLLGNEYYPNGSSGNGFSFSYQTKEGWSFPQNAKVRNFVNTDQYVNFFPTADGKTILMNIAKSGTRGESDLHVSFRNNDGSWTEPLNMGNVINSSGAECTPFLAPDNVTLFFASDGFNGYGSHDIYMSKRLDDSWVKWSEPLNLGPDINSNAWDAYFTLPAKGDFAYLVKDGDIYRVRLNEEVKPEPVVLIHGRVLDSRTNLPLEGAIKYEDLESGKEVGIARSNPVTGEYKIILPKGHSYGFLAEKEKYYAVGQSINTERLLEYEEIVRDIKMEPMEVGAVIRLNNIFFEYAKSELKSESFAELNRVIELLKENSTLKIQLSGHTDDIGNQDDNLVLSQQRAEAVVSYFISKGISKERLKAIGFGKNMPLVPNSSDENRQINRRVEFVIMKI